MLQRKADLLTRAMHLGNKAAWKRHPRGEAGTPVSADDGMPDAYGWYEFAEGWTAGYLAGRKAAERKSERRK